MDLGLLSTGFCLPGLSFYHGELNLLSYDTLIEQVFLGLFYICFPATLIRYILELPKKNLDFLVRTLTDLLFMYFKLTPIFMDQS